MTLTLFANQVNAARPWYATAAVDAGGALGGGSAVASICPPCSASPPWGWAAIGGGGLIGAAAASLAYMPHIDANDNSPLNKQFLKDLQSGITHNMIVIDYQAKFDNFNTASYINLINENNIKYNINFNIDNNPMDLNFIVYESIKIANSSDEDIFNMIKSNFNLDQDKAVFDELLTKIKSYNNFSEFDNQFLPISETYRDRLSNDLEKTKFDLFLSVFSYSAALNN